MEASQLERLEEGLEAKYTYLLTEDGRRVPVSVLARRVPVYSERKRGTVYIPFLDDHAIDYIAAQIKELIADGFDCIVMITGARRKGKSTLGIKIARKVSDKFTLDDIAFRLEDFSRILDDNPYASIEKNQYPQAFLDEAGVGLYNKEWFASWQRNLVKCLQVIGIKRQICYFILPHARKLTGDVRDEMASIWIDVDTKYKHERGYAEYYTGVRDKFKQSIWWRPKFAFKFKALDDDFFHRYEEKKMRFVDEMSGGRPVQNEVDDLGQLVLDEISKGKTMMQVAAEYGTSTKTIYRHLRAMKTKVATPTS